MCGRYALHSHPDVVALQFGLGLLPAAALAAMVPRYNIAPTQDAPIVRFDPERGRELVVARWGLVPTWAKDASMGAKLINARAETVAEKPSFRSAWRKRRCLVPADGWYEWNEEGGRRQPWYLYPLDGKPAALAGIWEQWHAPDGGMLETYSLITTEPNADAAQVHDRMPVVVDPSQFPLWLEGSAEQAAPLLRAMPVGRIGFHRVDRRMSSGRVDDAQCIVPVGAPEPMVAAPKKKKAAKAEADGESGEDRQGRLL